MQELHDQAAAARDVEDGERFDQAITEAKSQLNSAEGETLGIDDLSDIYI